MTQPEVLVDPGQAFLDRGYQQPAPTDLHGDRTALELSAGVAAGILLVRRALTQEQPKVGLTREQAIEAFEAHTPSWVKLVRPALRMAYERSTPVPLAAHEVVGLVDAYAGALGEYVATSSADALTTSFETQLSAKWDRHVAWHRASAAYGLDERQIRAYTTQVMNTDRPGNQGLIPTGLRMLIDSYTSQRAQAIGDNEAHTGAQVMQALGWALMANSGRLPAGSTKEWDAADEQACLVCAPMHHVQVPVTAMFTLPDGNKLLAPGAHPGCRCVARLVRPAVSKAYDPHERRDGNGRWTETTHREPAETEDWLERQKQHPAAPASPFRQQGGSPFSSSSPFGQRSPFRSASPFRSERQASPFGRQQASLFGSPFRTRGNPIHRTDRVVIIPKSELPPVPADGSAYFVAADTLNAHHNLDNGPHYNYEHQVEFTGPNGGMTTRKLTSPWEALNHNQFQDAHRVGMHVSTEEMAELWRPLVIEAASAADDAIDDARYEDIVGQLTPSALREISDMAGDTFISEDHARKKLLSQIHQVNLTAPDRGSNPSLAHAYVDYVVWAHPEYLGGAYERDMKDLMDQAELGGLDVRSSNPKEPVPFEQVFRVEPGPGEQNYGGGRLGLTGSYSVVAHDYRSTLLDYPGYADEIPPMLQGLRITWLTPKPPKPPKPGG